MYGGHDLKIFHIKKSNMYVGRTLESLLALLSKHEND